MVIYGCMIRSCVKWKDLIMVPKEKFFFKWQRAMTMRKVLQEILEKNPRFHHLTPLKTKHIAHWCRCHGYTPPDPESLRNDGDSIEDVLTQIDSEPGKPSVALPRAPGSLGAFAEVERGEDLEELL